MHNLASYALFQVTRDISVHTGWIDGSLIRGFKDSMILAKEGLFHGSLQMMGYPAKWGEHFEAELLKNNRILTYLAQQDSIMAAACGFTSLGISSLLPLKPTAATTCNRTSRQLINKMIRHCKLHTGNTKFCMGCMLETKNQSHCQ